MTLKNKINTPLSAGACERGFVFVLALPSKTATDTNTR